MQSLKVTALPTYLLLITLEAQLILATPRWSWSLFPRRQGRAIDNLHSGEHCVDVSTYEPVAFKDVTVEVCDSTFEKTCEQKTDQVRKDIFSPPGDNSELKGPIWSGLSWSEWDGVWCGSLHRLQDDNGGSSVQIIWHGQGWIFHKNLRGGHRNCAGNKKYPWMQVRLNDWNILPIWQFKGMYIYSLSLPS